MRSKDKRIQITEELLKLDKLPRKIKKQLKRTGQYIEYLAYRHAYLAKTAVDSIIQDRYSPSVLPFLCDPHKINEQFTWQIDPFKDSF